MSIAIEDCPCSGKNMSNLTGPWILLILYSHEGTHGYEIKKIINDYLGDLDIPINITGLYRHLKILEERGMLFSKWDTPNKGPAKRKFFLTETGKKCLWRWMQTLSLQLLLIDKFFDKARAVFPSASLPKVQIQVNEVL